MMERGDGGLGEMNIPMIADLDQSITAAYDCQCDEGYVGVSFRATYIIDDKGILRHESQNDITIGRDVDEYMRLLREFQNASKQNERSFVNT